MSDDHSIAIVGMYLFLDLAIIIAAARSFGALARRLQQPAVVGEIVAGILLGPTVLGRLFPGLPDALFPQEVPLRELADLGLVFFMFLVGLELDPRLIRQEGRRALSISLSGLVLPFGLGVLIAFPLLELNNGGIFAEGVTQPPTALAFSLFMGAAMCITAFPVLARILVERGLYKSPLGTAALCAAAVDDVVAWVLLAAVVGIARTGSAGQAAIVFVLAALFAVVMSTAVRRLLARLAARHDATGRVSVDQVAAVVVGLLLSALAAEWIGIHSIFGAFLFGAVMPRRSRMTRELTDKIEDFTVVVLLPVFFTVAGLRTNLFSIDSVTLLSWTVLVIAAAIVGKMAGCGVAARLNGYSSRDALALGTLMNTRGLTELVILSVGLSQGVLSDRTFAMMVVMALVTTVMAAPIVNRIMPRREMVRVLSGGDPEPAARRVLIELGHSENGRALVDAGVLLTGGQLPSELLLVRLIPTSRAPEFRSGLRDEDAQADRPVDAFDGLERQAADAGVRVRAVSFLSDDLGRDLAYVAATQKCDTVVLGWHRASLELRGVRALAHRLLALAPADVIVFVDREGAGIRRHDGRPVLVAAGSSPAGAAVAAVGRRVAASLRADVHAVGDEVEDAVRASGQAAVAVVAVGGWNDDEEFGRPATAIAARAACPVLVVRPAVKGAPAIGSGAGTA